MTTHQAAPQRPLPRYIRRPEVRRMLGNISGKVLNRLITDGVIPPPRELSCRLKLFNADDVIAAVERRTRPPGP
jgi:predicted DNA-binding transcriptional regulator AlpA